MSWITQKAKPIDQASVDVARQHQSLLTKPAGSLGRLESLAIQFAGWQGHAHPTLNDICVVVFAGDHGVCQHNVSAFPQVVTAQMIINFFVLNMGTVSPLPDEFVSHPRLIEKNIAAGTADFSQQAAMTVDEVDAALNAGRSIVESSNAQLFIGGEMGIGNTSSASAIYAALLSLSAKRVVGPGTGIDQQGIDRKRVVIEKALALHQDQLNDPYQVLRCLGGLEIAGLVGCYIACAQQGIPVLVDGFICTAAALLAIKLNPSAQSWFLFSHQSAEPAHALALEYLSINPLLNLGFRLGEGSGAAVAVPIIQSALSLHNNMATFTQAGVSEDMNDIDDAGDG